MARLISPDSGLARALEASRGAINAAWEMRKGNPSVDPDAALARFGQAALAIHAAHAALDGQVAADDAVTRWALPLFDSLLPGGGMSLVALCAAAIRLFVRDPADFLSCTMNALASLRMRPILHDPHATERWLGTFSRAGPYMHDRESFMKAGCVAAWISGFVEYRAAALRYLSDLKREASAALLGISIGGEAGFERALILLANDPWRSPERAFADIVPRGSRHYFAIVGGHTSAGGCFDGPPTVSAIGDQIIIHDPGPAGSGASRDYIIVACPEGARLVPSGSEIAQANDSGETIDPYARDGLFLVPGSPSPPDFRRLDPLGSASIPGTLAISSPQSYFVFVMGAEAGE